MSQPVPYIEKQRPWERPRTQLAEKLPLDTPFSVQIDPSSRCNFRCQFCPTGHPELLKQAGRSTKGQLMRWDLYEKLIGEIAQFPRPLKTLSLHKDGEPLLNPRLPDMAALAKHRGVAEKLVLLTNASLLTREKSIALIEAGVDVIRVSVEHVSPEGYRKHTQNYSDYEKIVHNVRSLREEVERRGGRLFITAKLIDFGLDDAELKIFHRDFEPFCHEIGRTTAQGWSHSEIFDFTLGTQPKVSLDGHTLLKPNRVVCPFPFYTLAINADGTVSPCPDDWSYKAVIGDVNTETLQEIWNGERLRAFRMMHLNGERHRNDACRHCHCIQGIPNDSDLDADRTHLVQLFGAGR